MQVDQELDGFVNDYIQYLENNYKKWSGIDESSSNPKFDVIKGRNYWKIVHVYPSGGHAAHSFIVIKPANDFQFGAILKAASWASPAKNYSRGNVVNRSYGSISWSGC